MNNSKYEPGARLWEHHKADDPAENYIVEALRSDKPADEHGRTHWRMEIDTALWKFWFYAWLSGRRHPLDSAHKHFAETFGAEIDAAKSWPVDQVEHARAVLAHAQHNVANQSSTGQGPCSWPTGHKGHSSRFLCPRIRAKS